MLKFIIFVFIPILLFSQNPRDYFPTHLGDMWQYIDSDGYYTNYTIVNDSVDSLGNEYVDFKIQYLGFTGSHMEKYLIDTLDQVFLLDNTLIGGQFLFYNLLASAQHHLRWFHSNMCWQSR